MPTSSTNPQHMKALESANAIRSYRAALKRNLGALSAGQSAVAAAEIVREEPVPELRTMRVHELLVAPTQMGKARASAFLRMARIHPDHRLAELTEQQRNVLLMLLMERADRYGQAA